MALAYFLIATLALAVVSAEPPSPYHYNRPAQPIHFPAQSISIPQPLPAPVSIPSGSYGAPSFQAVPSFKPAPVFQPAPSYSFPSPSVSHHVHEAPSQTVYQPSFASIKIPSTSYGFPSAPLPSFSGPSFAQLPSSNGFHGASSNQNAFVSNAIGGGAIGGDFDHELKSTIESILLKEESRAAAEYVEDAPRIVSIAMEGPRPAVGVAQFVLNGHGGGGHIGGASHQINVPAPVYGPALG